MLPLVLACSFPYFGSAPTGNAVHALLFYHPAPEWYAGTDAVEWGRRFADGLRYPPPHYDEYFRRGLEPGWVARYVRVEPAGPGVFRLTVVGCGDPREYQARMLNALLVCWRDYFVPLTRRQWERTLQEELQTLERFKSLRDARRRAMADPATFAGLSGEKRQQLLENERQFLLREEEEVARREVRVERLRGLVNAGYPRFEILRPARP